jgi:tetratricopeptide (TPR) repeat protein
VRSFPFLEITKLNSTSLQTLFVNGVRLHQSGRLAEAEAIYRQVLEVEPRHADCLHLLGVAATQQGRHEAAIALIGRAIAEKGDMAPYHANLGTSLRALERYADAESAYRRAIELKPDYADAYNHLGTTLRDLGRMAEGEACYLEALKRRPDYAEAYNNLGNLLRETKQLAAAEAAYHQALRFTPPQHPKVAAMLRNVGAVLHDLERDNEAETAFRTSLQCDPMDAATHDGHATALRELDQLDLAEAAARRAIALAPETAAFHVDYAVLLKAMGRVGLGEIVCRRGLAIDPDYAEGHNCLGGLLFDLGRMGPAEAEMRRALSMSPDNIPYHLSFAAAHKYQAGDEHLAELEVLAARAGEMSDADQAHLHFALAKAYEDVGAKDLGFEQQRLGNQAKRRTFEYDEAALLAQIERIKAVFSPKFVSSLKRGYKMADGPIFILGMMRSGSTLVEQILASHPQVFGAGELTLFRQALNAVSGQKPYPEAIPSMSAGTIDAVGLAYQQRLRREAPDSARITDKYLHNFLYCGLIALAMPQARIIHTVRDPVDTCLSIYSKMFTGHHPYAYDLAELGRYHRAYQSLMDHWRQVLPEGAMIDLRYEEVVDDLEGQARRLLDHCDLPWDDAVLAFHNTDRAVRTASATQVRQPLYKSSVGRWRPPTELLRPLTEALGLS